MRFSIKRHTKRLESGLSRCSRREVHCGRAVYDTIKVRRGGLTILELITTLVLVAMVSAAVVRLLHSTLEQSSYLQEQMSRLATVQHCLDVLVNDLGGYTQDATLAVDHYTVGEGRETSSLQIRLAGEALGADEGVEWVAGPRYEQEDLVLFRRSKSTGGNEKAVYVPMCEHLCSFEVETLDSLGQLATGAEAAVLEVTARVFRGVSRDPQQVFTVQRTFCLDRFKFGNESEATSEDVAESESTG